MKNNAIIFDTSTLLSALLFRHSTPHKALQKGLSQYTIFISEETEKELLQVISRKKFDRYYSKEARHELATQFLLHTTLITAIDEVEHNCRDPKDVPFLALSYTIKADIIVSSDQDLLVLSPFYQTKIMTPAEFIN